MNLYLIERDDPRDEVERDEHHAHVIAANSEKDAREIADITSMCFKDHHVGQIWLNAIEDGRAWPYGSTVTTLATDVSLVEGIILSES